MATKFKCKQNIKNCYCKALNLLNSVAEEFCKRDLDDCRECCGNNCFYKSTIDILNCLQETALSVGMTQKELLEYTAKEKRNK